MILLKFTTSCIAVDEKILTEMMDEFYSLRNVVMAASDVKSIDLVSGTNRDAYNKGILVKPLLEEGWYELEPDGTVTPTEEPA